MLTLMEGPTATADRARLETLPPREKYLAVTKAHYDNIRANVTYARLDARGRDCARDGDKNRCAFPVI
jgi:hypothetical protein